jgi:hypothetical protein
MRQLLARALVMSALVYVVVAATAGTISFITPLLPEATPLIPVAEFARLLVADLEHGAILQVCQPFRCFKEDTHGYQGLRALTP